MSVARSLGVERGQQRVGGEERLVAREVDAGVQLVGQPAGEHDHREERRLARRSGRDCASRTRSARPSVARTAEAGEGVAVAAEGRRARARRRRRRRACQISITASGIGRPAPSNTRAAQHDRAGRCGSTTSCLFGYGSAVAEERADGLAGRRQRGSSRGSLARSPSGSNQVRPVRRPRCPNGSPAPTRARVRSWSYVPISRSRASWSTDRIVDRIEREQRVAREVHLRDDALRERRAEHREVDVRRPPRVHVVLPRVRARA